MKMRRRGLVAILGLCAWVTGSALGAVGPVAAHASAGIVVGKAHAGYTPSLTGTKPVVILAVGSGARPGDDVMHSLSDSIHLIFLKPGQAPRDDRGHPPRLVGAPSPATAPRRSTRPWSTAGRT